MGLMKTIHTMSDRELAWNCLDFTGMFHSIIPPESQWHAYCLCDGFGKMTSEQLRGINGGWDWSHVRDSSDEAMKECAQFLREYLTH